MSILRTPMFIALLVLSSSAVAPALAAPNDGRFQQSSEALNQAMVDCAFYRGMLDIAERKADERAGTQAAAKYAREADKWWSRGERAGCAWAS